MFLLWVFFFFLHGINHIYCDVSCKHYKIDNNFFNKSNKITQLSFVLVVALTIFKKNIKNKGYNQLKYGQEPCFLIGIMCFLFF